MSLFNILRRVVGTEAVDICLDVFDMFGQLTGVFMATLGRFGVSPGYFQVIFLMFPSHSLIVIVYALHIRWIHSFQQFFLSY